MEQTRYWMWTKRKHDFTSTHNHHVLSSTFGDSWEEQAFAEDAAGGPLGAGCIWPPRSYSCGFCQREFKSAQALGGHMNVHRRDRARLKQSPNNPNGEGEVVDHLLHQNHHILKPRTSFQYSPQICTSQQYLYKPNSDSDQQVLITSSPIRVSSVPLALSNSDNSEDKTTAAAATTTTNFSVPAPLFTSIINKKNATTTEKSWSNFVTGDKSCFRHTSDSKNNNNNNNNNNEDKKMSTISSNTTCKSSSESNMSVSLNLLLCRTQTNYKDGDKEISSPTTKRRRLIDASSFTLFPKSSSEALLFKNNPPGSMEDLDLELRLGDPPKVK